jgi:plastocyanin
MKRLVIACVALMLALIVLAPAAGAVGARGDHVTGGTPRQRVRIIDNAFRPGGVTVARGTIVKWVNRGSRTHTTTSDDGLWDRRLSPDDSFSRRFRRRGTFEYHCTIHATMMGTITVT